MPLSPLLTHLIEQAVAAHLEADTATVDEIYHRMHRLGFCSTAHILIDELNRSSVTRIAAGAITGQPRSIQIHIIN